MFDRLEISLVPSGPRFRAHLRILVNGEDVVAGAVGDGGRGPLVADALPAGGGPGVLWATGEARRVELGEPECSGGCCGFLSVVVQRFGGVVQWSDWQVPYEEVAPPEFHFDAERYDAELARVDVGTGRSGAS
ncbi:hypothetical protein [Streptomyces durocortorensis]|uniref:Uncharacterized protein n=1 Tax=Streptomyces durocortorensis TaxID=2811104 RepID=A0ABS2HXY6_9ACTN|nr:hypothetical protein [Streptomyces durocortorensis]MBM7055884.1 hypothetical protein [Streptomyces durocortorensis]